MRGKRTTKEEAELVVRIALQVSAEIRATRKTGRSKTFQRGTLKRTAELTKLNTNTVGKILREFDASGSVPEPPKKRPRRSEPASSAPGLAAQLRTQIHHFYVQNLPPTVKGIHAALTQAQDKTEEAADESGGVEEVPKWPLSVTTTYRLMLTLGFKYEKRNSKFYLLERPDLVQKRFEYLCNVLQYREENRSFVYLDETFFNAHDTHRKCWRDKERERLDTRRNLTRPALTDVPSSRGSRVIILHAGNENGFLRGIAMSTDNLSVHYCRLCTRM